jgi:hypothetical protein
MNRLAVESVLIFGLSYTGVRLGFKNITRTLISYLAEITNIKYNLTMAHDPRYMSYLKEKAREFKYKSEFNLLRDVLTNREYL